jgi:hypothetical protein
MEDWVTQIIDELKKTKQNDQKTSNFIEQIGATMIGVKPACLVSISSKKCLKLCKTNFTNSSPVAFVVVKCCGEKKQLFIYHKEKLRSVLTNAKNRRCLIELGYPKEGNVETYVRLLVEKLRSEQFPHESGLFFGYPLKDVCGFMGKAIPYRKTMGWRMYGDTRISENVYYQFKNARSYVRDMLLRA